MTILSDKTTDAYLYPNFFERSVSVDFNMVFEDIVLTDEIIDLGGHWICGVRTFVHDPYVRVGYYNKAGHNIFPVVAGKVWPLEIGPEEGDPAKLDRSIASRLERLPRIKAEREDRRNPPPLGPDGFASAHGIAAAFAKALRPDFNPPTAAQIQADQEDRLRNWKNPWPGRERDGPYAHFSDLGYHVLMGVNAIVNGLTLDHITRAAVIGTIEPKTHEKAPDDIEPSWWREYIKIDFERGLLFAGQPTDPPTWTLKFSNIGIYNKDWMAEKNREYQESQRRVNEPRADPSTDQEETTGQVPDIEPRSNREKFIQAYNQIKREGKMPSSRIKCAEMIKEMTGYSRSADYVARELRSLQKAGRIDPM